MPGYSLEHEAFERDGFVLIPGLLRPDETELLLGVARGDRTLHDHAFDVKDTSGRASRLSLWNHPGDDIYGMVSRSERIVSRMETYLGGEVYHYHSKLMLKEPRVGGAWEWHQDYGYWYQNGCLFPYMASCLIALDRATRENGCLQVLKGSHLMGRIEHGRFGEQTGADPERVAEAMKRLELVYCEMEPGTGLFFHGNLLHASSANTSERPRWSLICCYNAARNDPYKDSHHPRYTPLSKVGDEAILAAAARSSDAAKSFLNPADDRTTGAAKS
ncbi:MAG TPA: phytanoyl-CoA dioxygenase family protein [Solibacterales bacterium]|nr:phytanoyl-CoA dioxygenase family protein [Bryobacterales bacterium]